MAKKSGTDTDIGLENILKEMEKLKSMCVKIGVTEDTGSQAGEDGVTVAQYASWNELGTDDGRIPSRPFVRGWADGKRELIALMMEKLGGLVTSGKLDADTAIRRLAGFGKEGVGSYIDKDGSFTPNADSTIAKKGSSKPLIDTGTMRNAIQYQIIQKPVGQVSE